MGEIEALEHEVAHLRRQLAASDDSLTTATAEILRLRKIEAAARNLVAQKGRHHTEHAYNRLAALVVPNVELRGCALLRSPARM